MAKKSKKAIVAIELAETDAMELDQARDQSQRMLERCAGLVVETQEQVQRADKCLLAVHECVKWIEARKELLIRPHLDGAAGIRDKVRPIEECLKSAKDLLKSKIAQAERASRAAQQHALLQVQAGERDQITLTIAHQHQVHSAAVRSQAYWQAVVDDFAALPDGYKVADMAKLHALARAGGTPPAGVRFVEGYTLVTQGSKS